MFAKSALKDESPSDCNLGGVEFLRLGAAWLLAALAWVKNGPATDEVVPAETDPMLICDSDILDTPLLTLEVSLTSSPCTRRLSLRYAIKSAFFLSSSYFFFFGSSGSR